MNKASFWIKKSTFFSFFVFCIGAIFFSTCYFYAKNKEQYCEAEKLNEIQNFAKDTLAKRKKKSVFLTKYKQANPQFVEDILERLEFLKKEQDTLRSYLNHPAYSDHPLLNQQYAFLNGEENRLRFKEESIYSRESVRETLEKQTHPVIVDFSDLMNLLAKIENDSSAPQLIIKNLQLKKKETPLQTEVFELEMDFIKREF